MKYRGIHFSVTLCFFISQVINFQLTADIIQRLMSANCLSGPKPLVRCESLARKVLPYGC